MGPVEYTRASARSLTHRTLVCEGMTMALAPIHHGGEGSDGTIKPFAVERIIDWREGVMLEIPRISGNSLRGQWRDIAARTLLWTLGVDEQSLTPSAFYFLFSGGSLTKSQGGNDNAHLDVGAARTLGRLIPSVALFGGGVGNQLLPGKLQVGMMRPICRELRHVLPVAYQPFTTMSIWDMRDVQYFSRQDDARSRDGFAFLPEQDRQRLEAPRTRTVAKRPASPSLFGEEPPPTAALEPVATEQRAAKPGTAMQMRYGFETLAAGTPFYHRMVIHDASDIEYAAFLNTIREWSRNPVIGGKSSIGFGLIGGEYTGTWGEAEARLQLTDGKGAPIEVVETDAAWKHVTTHRQEILDLLGTL